MPCPVHLLPFLLALTAVAGAADLSIRGTTDKDVAIYQPGEPIVFTLSVLDGETPVPGSQLKWTRTGDDGQTATGAGIAGADGLTVTTSLDKPGFVRLQVHAFGADGKPLQGSIGGFGGADWKGDIAFDGGACVQPEKLQPVAEPSDFDAFWTTAKTALAAVPMTAQLTEIPSKDPKIHVYAATITCAGPRPVTGYLTVPVGAKDASLPAIVQFQGYGVNRQNPPGWLNPRAIFFEINAHGMELGRDDAYYEQLKKDLGKYAYSDDENRDRTKTYYYGMALRVMRALAYVKSRPEWNGKDLSSNGGSQGGAQGLWGAALDGAVTSCDVWSPWCCDFGGITLGRQRGQRPNYFPALDYYDSVFHARRITTAKVHLIANYGDTNCVPSGVWTVYNNLPGERKSMQVKQGCSHMFQMKHAMLFTIAPGGITDVGPMH